MLTALAWATAVGVVVLVRARSSAVLVAAACQLAVACLAWLRWNKRYEGRILLTISANHGVTAGDLLVVPAAAVGVALLARAWRTWALSR